MEWYEELDYEENPFKDNEETELIGYEDIIDEVIYRIASGNIVCVEGKSGEGKTAVLKAIINKFGGQGKIVYLNCQKLSNGLNIEKVLTKKSGLRGRLFNKKPKNMILLMDEVQYLSPKNCERLKYFFDHNFLKSIVFTSSDFKGVGFTQSLRDRISKTIKLRQLTEDEAIDVVNSRLGTDELIPEEVLKEVYSKSKRNMKLFLNNCERLCKHALETNGKKVLPEHMEDVFGKKELEKEEVQEVSPKESSEKPKKEQKIRKKTNSSKKEIQVAKKIESKKETPKGDTEEPVTIVVNEDFRPTKKEKIEEFQDEEEIDIDKELKKLGKAKRIVDDEEFEEEDYDEDYKEFQDFDEEDEDDVKKVDVAEKYY